MKNARRLKIQCENLIPSNNFENLDQCSNKATAELTFVGGKVACYCLECQPTVVNIMMTFNGEKGKIASFRIL